MRYAIYSYANGERTEAMARTMIEVTLDPNTQCRVVQATTVEDERHLGYEWNCDHCLPPTECIYCNPEHRGAYTSHCTVCHPDSRSMGQTWHHADGHCLKCELRDND